MKKGVAAILILLIFPSIGLAQSTADDPGSTGGVRRIALMVEMDQQRRSPALEFRYPAQSFDRGLSQAQPKARSGHPVLIGAAIGAGAGFLINATACRTGESVCTAPGNILMAGIGAGVGALVGVLVSRH
jgi:hypothetical protein